MKQKISADETKIPLWIDFELMAAPSAMNPIYPEACHRGISMDYRPLLPLQISIPSEFRTSAPVIFKTGKDLGPFDSYNRYFLPTETRRPVLADR